MDNNEEEVAFMDMPCQCDCGNWFDLNKGFRDRDYKKNICRECKEREEAEDELEDE